MVIVHMLITTYKPISMLSNFAKILEKIIKSRLIQVLETKKMAKNRVQVQKIPSTYSVNKCIQDTYENSKKAM